MPTDYARITSQLAMSKTQSDNNALYQSILGLINGGKENFETTASEVLRLANLINGINGVVIVEVDTSLVAPTYEIAAYVTKPTIFKDVSGNAAANNITLTGTVDGTVDPVINSDFGFYRVFKSSTGAFFTW